MRKIFSYVLILIFLFFISGKGVVSAQEVTSTPTPTPTPTQAPDNTKATQDLQNQINELQSKLSSLKGQEKTLSSQISAMDSQIKLTELRIQATRQDITNKTKDISTTTKKISDLEKELNALTEVVLNRIVATYEVGTLQPFQIFFASNGFSDFLSRISYLRIAQVNDKKLILETQQAKMDYTNQKDILENKRKQSETLKVQLESYTKELNQQKAAKQQLLAETQGSESNYQRLLAAAQAQLAAFSNFTAARGGASILNNQTVCDDWGCYYNQRDSQWGSTELNHTQYTIASDGCLVTAMAMVYTHYGHKGVTPLTINSEPNNFASYFPAYLKYTITADGATSNRIGAIIDGVLALGNPVVVGVSYDGGPIPDHFVVLVSGSGGNYIMNDPFTPNGHKISFTDHYSIGGIREIDKVVF